MKHSDDTLTVKLSLTNFLWAVGIVVGLYFLIRVQQIVMTLFFAIIVMSALKPSVFWLEKKLRFPRIASILLLYTWFIFLIGLAITVIVPPLAQELPNFIQTLSLPPLPSDIAEFKMSLSQLSNFLPQLGTSFNTVFSILSSTFNGIFTFVTILVMASYMLLDRERLHLKISWFSRQPRHLEMAKQLINEIEHQLGGWVRGQISLMIIIGLISYLGLTLLGVPYALPLAVAAGLLEVLPNLGPMLAGVPAVGISFLVGGPALALFTTLFYILVQQFENNLIVPKVMQENVDVNPLTAILVILIGVKLGGVLGALLSIPVYIVARSIYGLWYREHHRSKEASKEA